MPRILPLVGIAMGGVLAINALAGARGLPNLFTGAKAFAEEAGKGKKADKEPADQAAASVLGSGQNASAVASAGPRPAPVCAPTAAELAKEAGLSPAELQVLQSLGERRGQLDQRENDLNTQIALLAAAEAKLDAKVNVLNGLKADIQNMFTQADQKDQAEVDRMVAVYSAMKPKDSAARMVLLDDSVRLPIAAKMKPRALSAMLAQMPPPDAKKLTEALAGRFAAIKQLAQNANNAANQAAAQVPTPQTPGAQASATPPGAAAGARAPAPQKVATAKRRKKPTRLARKSPRKTAPKTAQAANNAASPAAGAAAGQPAAAQGG